MYEVDEGHYCHSNRKSLCRALLVMLGHCNLYTWIIKKEKKKNLQLQYECNHNQMNQKTC
jgi:hypothetical protein